jgi:hypothetical protein
MVWGIQVFLEAVNFRRSVGFLFVRHEQAPMACPKQSTPERACHLEH